MFLRVSDGARRMKIFFPRFRALNDTAKGPDSGIRTAPGRGFQGDPNSRSGLAKSSTQSRKRSYLFVVELTVRPQRRWARMVSTCSLWAGGIRQLMSRNQGNLGRLTQTVRVWPLSPSHR